MAGAARLFKRWMASQMPGGAVNVQGCTLKKKIMVVFVEVSFYSTDA